MERHRGQLVAQPYRPSPSRERPVWAYPEGLVVCPGCRVAFWPVRAPQVYCSNACRMRVVTYGPNAPDAMRRRARRPRDTRPHTGSGQGPLGPGLSDDAEPQPDDADTPPSQPDPITEGALLDQIAADLLAELRALGLGAD